MSSLQFHALETPCLLLDHARLIRNIAHAQDIATTHGVKLRPHIKSHKCREIATLQMEHGAVGLTASKSEEARCFVGPEYRSVTVGYPLLDRRKLDRLLSQPAPRARLQFVVDSMAGIATLVASCRSNPEPTAVFLEIDVGLHRCGIEATSPDLVPLAERIGAEPALSFAGLFAHAGHAYAATSIEEVRAVARAETEALRSAVERLERGGIAVAQVSVGSTPTVLAAESFANVTEIRPGNYVFLDRTAVALGLVPIERVALSVLAMVVSQNDDYFIIDAGSKVLSSDSGAHGSGKTSSFGAAYPAASFGDPATLMEVVKLSEEHGWIRKLGPTLGHGELVRVVPNHACPVANLAREFVVLRDDRPAERWSIDAHGCVR